MRSLALLALSAAALTQLPGDARAESTPYFYLGPQISTLGFGGEAGVRLNDFLGLRAGGNYFSYDGDEEIDDTDYDFDLDLASAGAVLDVHPFGTGFRLTGGFRWNGNGADLTATPNGTITVGDQTFTAAEAGRVTGEIDFNSFAPYTGFGYQGGLFGNRLLLSFDLGVLFQGDPDVDLDGDGTLANDPAFRAELKNEADEIEDELAFLGFYPVAALTATYRF